MLLKLQPSEQGFLDLHRLVRRLVTEDGFPDSKTALRAISAYERFFMLVASHQTEPLSPSQAVDLVWQRHMLDTRAYMQDCHRLAGSYIHRFKGSPPNAFERCVQILRVSGEAEWEHPSSSHTFPSTEINSDCIPCSCDLDEENLSELINRVQVSLQNKSSNLPWVAQSLRVIDSDSMQAIGEYKRFLRLLITENISLTPSKLVDEFWHQHILNSTEYFQFCIRAAGRYIHHVPHYEKPHSFHRNGFNRTQTFYKKYFGIDSPQTIWSHMGESGGCEPEPLYFRDSPTSVVVKLVPRNVNKEHYTQIHPVFRSKGMSINLWIDFLRDIDNVPLMSGKEYMNLEENSYFSWLDRAFFHVWVFAWVVVPFALGYSYSNQTFLSIEFSIDFVSYFGSLSLLQRGWYVWSGVNFYFPGFLPNKFLQFFKLSRMACCIASLCIFMKQTILLKLFIGVLLFLSLSTHFCLNWYKRSFNPKTLQKILSRYADLFSEMGVIVALSDDMTITIEAHL